jgi:hypothetical protein
MNEEVSWQPVTIAGRKALATGQGRVTIEWQLEGGLSQSWIRAFRPTGSRQGSLEFVFSNSEPSANMDGTIAWTVPEADIASADAYVKHSVELTNASYLAQSEASRAIRERQRVQEKARADHLAELQRKLDELP